MDAGFAGSTLRGPQKCLPADTRSRSEARRVVSTVSLAPSYPRGNPLTESMEFSDRDGAVWLVYIEGAPRPPGWYLESGTALPDRHLRFDSASESRFTSHLPAGSPFLAEARLQSLLDEAQPDPPLTMTTGSPAPALSARKIGRSSGPPGPSRRVVRRLRTGLDSGSRQRVGWRHYAATSTSCCPGPPTRCTGWSRASCAIGRLGHRPAASIGFR